MYSETFKPISRIWQSKLCEILNLGSADDIDIFGASVSDEDDADPVPWESKPLRADDPILPDGSSKSKLSPLLAFHRGSHAGGGHSNRPEPPPVIIKQSLKNFSGLEGVSSLTLSTQDSLETSSVPRGNQSEASTHKGGSISAPSTNAICTGITSSSSNTTPLTSVSETNSALSSSLAVASNITTVPKRSIQAEISAPLATTNYSNSSSNNPVSASQMASSSSSSTLFAKVGRSTKKHSLDEEFLNVGATGMVKSILTFNSWPNTPPPY